MATSIVGAQVTVEHHTFDWKMGPLGMNLVLRAIKSPTY